MEGGKMKEGGEEGREGGREEGREEGRKGGREKRGKEGGGGIGKHLQYSPAHILCYMSYTYSCAHTSQALQPVVHVPIHPIAHHQHSVVQVGLGAEVIVVDTAVVELGRRGGREGRRRRIKE